MTTTLFTHNGPVPRDEEIIRSTTNTVDISAPADMQESAPDTNEISTAKHEDGGLTTNTLASHVVPSERYVPLITNADSDLFTQVNSQIASSGTAAAKEMSGQWGHGTMKIVEGIEPAIVPGTEFDNVYFKAHVGVVQGGSNSGMSAAMSDPAVTGLVEQARRAKAAMAAQAPLYAAFYDASQS